MTIIKSFSRFLKVAAFSAAVFAVEDQAFALQWNLDRVGEGAITANADGFESKGWRGGHGGYFLCPWIGPICLGKPHLDMPCVLTDGAGG